MLLVDAYNAIHVTGVLPPHLAGIDAPALAELVSGSRWGRGKALLVCDGTRPRGWPRAVGGVELRFAGPGRDADTLIERLLRDSPDPRRVTVVSSDQRLRRAAKRAGAASITSEGFLAQLASDIDAPKARAVSPAAGKPEVPLDPYALRRWLEEFGLGPDELRRIAGEASACRAAPLKVEPTRDHDAPRRAGEGRAAARREPTPPAGESRPLDLSDAQLHAMLADALKMWPGADLPADLDITQWLATLTDDPLSPPSRSARSSR